jgi:hypothetical protein
MSVMKTYGGGGISVRLKREIGRGASMLRQTRGRRIGLAAANIHERLSKEQTHELTGLRKKGMSTEKNKGLKYILRP